MTAVDSSTDLTNDNATTTILNSIQKACANHDAKQLEKLRVLLEENCEFPEGSARALLVAFNLGIAHRVLTVLVLVRHQVHNVALIPFEKDTLRSTLHARLSEPYSSDIQLVLAAWDSCMELSEKPQFKEFKSFTEQLKWSAHGFYSTRNFIDMLWSLLLSDGFDLMDSQKQESTIREIAACLLYGFPNLLLYHSPMHGWTSIDTGQTCEVRHSNLYASNACDNQFLLITRSMFGKKNKPEIAWELTRVDYKLLKAVYPNRIGVTFHDYRYDAKIEAVTKSMVWSFDRHMLPETRVPVDDIADAAEAREVTAVLARALLFNELPLTPPLIDRLKQQELELKSWLNVMDDHPTRIFIGTGRWFDLVVKGLNGATTVQAAKAAAEAFNPSIDDLVSMLDRNQSEHIRWLQKVFPSKIATATGDTLEVTYHRTKIPGGVLIIEIHSEGSASAVANLRDEDLPAEMLRHPVFIVHSLTRGKGEEKSEERFFCNKVGMNGVRRELVARQQSLLNDTAPDLEMLAVAVQQPGQQEKDKVLLLRNQHSGTYTAVWLGQPDGVQGYVKLIVAKHLKQYTDGLDPVAAFVVMVTNELLLLAEGDYSALPNLCSEEHMKTFLEMLHEKMQPGMQDLIERTIKRLEAVLKPSESPSKEESQFYKLLNDAREAASAHPCNFWKAYTLVDRAKDLLLPEWKKLTLNL